MKLFSIILTAICCELLCAHSSAQISLQAAVRLALDNSPRVKMARDDVRRASAAVAEANDAYIPNAGLGGAIGRSYGITLTVPTIITANTQSLIYSAAQRDYVHAARRSLEAAALSLKSVQQEIEEDVALNYVSLDATQQRRAALVEESEAGAKLVAVTEQRAEAGLESKLEVTRAQRAALTLKIELRQVEVDMAAAQEHLALLTGQPASFLTVLPRSIPALAVDEPPAMASGTTPQSASLRAAESNAAAKALQARAETRYAFRPQLFFQAQYGRVSPIQDVSQYYNLNGKYNIFAFAVQINLPLFDKAHAARATESGADAAHAAHEAEFVRAQQAEAFHRLQNSLMDLSNHVELARLDRDIAQGELAAMAIEVKTPSSGATQQQMTPKDELNARMNERRQYVNFLAADLEFRRAAISYKRQSGELEAWIASAP